MSVSMQNSSDYTVIQSAFKNFCNLTIKILMSLMPTTVYIHHICSTFLSNCLCHWNKTVMLVLLARLALWPWAIQRLDSAQHKRDFWFWNGSHSLQISSWLYARWKRQDASARGPTWAPAEHLSPSPGKGNQSLLHFIWTSYHTDVW